MKLHYRLGLLILALFHSHSYADCANTNVETLAKEFFELHRNFHYTESLEVKSLLAPDFYTILEGEYKCISQGELCAIEADPWLGAQDGEIAEPISFSITNKTALSASVKINYLFVLSETQKENREVILQFQKIGSGSCWLLSDFITPKEVSLKRHIKKWQTEYGSEL